MITTWITMKFFFHGTCMPFYVLIDVVHLIIVKILFLWNRICTPSLLVLTVKCCVNVINWHHELFFRNVQAVLCNCMCDDGNARAFSIQAAKELTANKIVNCSTGWAHATVVSHDNINRFDLRRAALLWLGMIWQRLGLYNLVNYFIWVNHPG